ncbi:hypothetical protein D3C78_1075910 [compost metagenome]
MHGRQVTLTDAHDGVFGAQAIVDQVGDGADPDPVLAREHFQVRAPGHGAVIVHHFDDHRGGRMAGQARQVAAGFGMAGAGQHAAFAGAQREDMARLHDVGGAGVGGDGGGDGACTISSRDTGGDTDGGLDGHGEGGAEHAAVARHHLLQAQAFAVLVGQGQADQATGFAGHEADRLGRAAVGGQQQVAFVFPVLIVDQQDHFAEAVIFDDFFDAVEGHAGVSVFVGLVMWYTIIQNKARGHYEGVLDCSCGCH